MTKRRRILFGILLVLLAGIFGGWVWFTVQQRREPVYQGKRLSVWLEDYDRDLYAQQAGIVWRNKDPDWQMADKAVRQIGTNAMPILLQLIRAQDSDLGNVLATGAEKLHLRKTHHVSTSQKHARGAFGMLALGATATNALPELLRIYEGTPYFELQADLPEVFGAMGPAAKPAIPYLLKSATNRNFGPYGVMRRNAAEALGNIHAEAEKVVPALMDSLSDPMPEVRVAAALALVNFGADAKPAAPRLTELLKDPSDVVKAAAGEALKKISPEAAATAGVK